MTDPAVTPSPTSSSKQLSKVFLFAAATDILAGLVLVALGLGMDEQVLLVAGLALALSGTGVLSYLIIRTSRPEQL